MMAWMGIAVALLVQATSAPAPGPVPTTGWTWTLYANDGPVVLANEVPDTPHLRTTLECTKGTGQARLTLYDTALTEGGSGTLTSGTASVQGEVAKQGARVQTQLRTNHPVFASFISTGRLSLTIEDQTAQVTVERTALPTLRRFAELCTG